MLAANTGTSFDVRHTKIFYLPVSLDPSDHGGDDQRPFSTDPSILPSISLAHEAFHTHTEHSTRRPVPTCKDTGLVCGRIEAR